MIKLNPRLELVAKKIPEKSQVLDVGCDHALLDIYLVQKDIGIRAVASDIKEGPIEQAKENIRRYHLEKEIETRIGKGIETIDENIDTIVISGMGGLNILGNLKYSTSKLKNVQRMILSPNNYAKEVREGISKLGYFLKDEELVEDRNYIYPIMVFEKGKSPYKKKDYTFSPILKKNKPPLFQKYLEKEKTSKEWILKSLPKKYFGRRWKIKKELKEIEKILKEM